MNFIRPMKFSGPGFWRSSTSEVPSRTASQSILVASRICPVLAPVGHLFVAHVLEIFEALLLHELTDVVPREVGRDVPIRIERRVADIGREHRRWIFGLADDHDHRIHRRAVLVHEEPLLRRVDEDVALLSGGKDPRALQVEREDLALVVFAILMVGQGVAQLAVERMHPAHRPDIFGKRRRRGRAEQHHQRRRRRRPKLGIDPADPGAGIVLQSAWT